MKSVLEELYEHFECPHNFLEDRKESREAYFQDHAAFFETLSKEQQTAFNNLWDQALSDLPSANCESFICAFQLGARMMLEVLAPIRSQRLHI